MTDKRVLYIADGISGFGGAHVATRLLLKSLWQRGYKIDVLGLCQPEEWVREMLPYARFYDADIPYHTFRWFVSGLYRRLLHSEIYPDWVLDPKGKIRKIASSYATICVMSEESYFRRLASRLPRRIRKIQLCHTNYKWWSMRHPELTRFDSEIYSRFDLFATVGKVNVYEVCNLVPSLSGKVVPFYNLIDSNDLTYFEKPVAIGSIRLVTLARVDDIVTKDGWRMIDVAARLKSNDVNFQWDVYGGEGAVLEAMRLKARALGIGDVFHLHGWVADAKSNVAKSDLMVLLSHVEGLPNVIYESLLVGTPVFSTNVGGIQEQIEDGKTGWLIEDDTEKIVEKLTWLLRHNEMLLAANRNLDGYKYDNEKILSEHINMLGL